MLTTCLAARHAPTTLATSTDNITVTERPREGDDRSISDLLCLYTVKSTGNQEVSRVMDPHRETETILRRAGMDLHRRRADAKRLAEAAAAISGEWIMPNPVPTEARS
ncbi:MAG TPA: hypothetical protein H9881_00855 [Candidatus Stackebrandtia excrementipullorum]|nr:hypothetical protein [Candidatus Stackebrandtia excrementipullorum]